MSKIRRFQVVLLLSCFVGHPVLKSGVLTYQNLRQTRLTFQLVCKVKNVAKKLFLIFYTSPFALPAYSNIYILPFIPPCLVISFSQA